MISRKLFLAALALIPSLGSANDNFADATVLNYNGTAIVLADSTENASDEEGEPVHDGVGNQSRWYQLTPTSDTRLEIEISYEEGQSSSLDAVLVVYTGDSFAELQVVSRYSTLFIPAASRRGVSTRDVPSEELSRNATLTVDVTANTTYRIVVAGENNRGPFTLNVRPSRNEIQPIVELLPAQSMWSHLIAREGNNPVDPNSLDPDQDFYSTWQRSSNYDGPAFAGPSMAPVGYDRIDNLLNPNASDLWILGTPDAPEADRYTAYLRTTFTPAGPIGALGIEGVFDDGAIIYINGNEVTRINMASDADPDNWQTLSLNNNLPEAPGTQSEEYIHYRNITGLNLPGGQPVEIAVSLHNASPGSSDLGMDMRIFGTAEGDPPPPLPIPSRIARGAIPNDYIIFWEADQNVPYNIETSATMEANDWLVVNANPISRSTSGETSFPVFNAGEKQFWRVVLAP